MVVEHPSATPTPLTPRRSTTTTTTLFGKEIAVVSPHSVRMLSPRRYTLEEMHQSLCMLDQPASSLDCPPLLPARHGSILLNSHHNDDSSLDRCCSDENHGFDLTVSLTHSRIRSNSRDNIVRILLPNSPNNTRASLTFSRLVSDLPRAGASRTRSSLPGSRTNERIGVNERMKARIFPYKSG
jgi:hypothetical protein